MPGRVPCSGGVRQGLAHVACKLLRGAVLPREVDEDLVVVADLKGYPEYRCVPAIVGDPNRVLTRRREVIARSTSHRISRPAVRSGVSHGLGGGTGNTCGSQPRDKHPHLLTAD